jgi:hypothetical protein
MGARMLSSEDLAALAQLPGLDAEQANLQRQLEAARALRAAPTPNYSSGAGALFGGLGTVFENAGISNQRRDLEAKMGELLKRRMAPDAAMARAKGLQLQQGLEKGGLDVEATRQRMGRDAAEEARLGSPIAPELSTMLNQFMPGRDFSGLTYRDLDRMIGPLATLSGRQEAAKDRAFQRTLAGQNRKDAAEAKLAEAANKRLETDVQKASKDFEEPASYEDALKTLDEALENKAGVGRLEGRLANIGIGSDQAIRNRQAMATLGNAVLRARAGTAVTPTEGERVQIETGLAPGATEEQFDVGARALRTVMRRAAASSRAKYRPEVVETIQSRGGYVPPAAGPAPEDTAALQWLRANPGHPQAAAVAQKLKAKGIGP